MSEIRVRPYLSPNWQMRNKKFKKTYAILAKIKILIYDDFCLIVSLHYGYFIIISIFNSYEKIASQNIFATVYL